MHNSHIKLPVPLYLDTVLCNKKAKMNGKLVIIAMKKDTGLVRETVQAQKGKCFPSNDFHTRIWIRFTTHWLTV